MKIRALLFICCTTILVSAVEAKIKEDEGAPKQIVHIKKMDKRVSELMADRVNIRKNMELKELATLSEIEMEEKENLMFPAVNLYGFPIGRTVGLIRFGELRRSIFRIRLR